MTTIFVAALAFLAAYYFLVSLAFLSLDVREGYLTRLERWWWNGR